MIKSDFKKGTICYYVLLNIFKNSPQDTLESLQEVEISFSPVWTLSVMKETLSL